MNPHVSPFVVAGELNPEQMIDRDREAAELATFGQSGQPFRLHGPRRYGKTLHTDLLDQRQD